MEGHRGDLEAEAHHEKAEADEEEGIAPRSGRHGHPELVEVGRARGAVDEGDPVHEEAGGERAQQEVLHGRLARLDARAEEAREHVERERHRLETQEDHDQVVGAGHDDHAHGREEHEDVELPRLLAAPAQVVHGQQEHEPGGVADDEVEEEGEIVEDDHAAEGRDVGAPQEHGGHEGGDHAGQPHEPQMLAPAARGQEIEGHEREARQREDEGRRDRDQSGEHVRHRVRGTRAVVAAALVCT